MSSHSIADTDPEVDTKADERPRFCLYVNEAMHTPNGFVPATVTEGEPGYRPMLGSGELAEPWYWGHDLVKAQAMARQYNHRLGLSDADADEIVSSSIAASIRADATRQRWEDIKAGRA